MCWLCCNLDFRQVQVRQICECEHSGVVIHTYAQWKTIGWDDIDTEKLLSENKNILKDVKEFGSKYPVAKQWGAYRDVETMGIDMNVVLPTIAELAHQFQRMDTSDDSGVAGSSSGLGPIPPDNVVPG